MGRPSTRQRTDFGKRIHHRREIAGLTQAEVAEQLGLSQRAYAAWERDPIAILPERLSTIAEILGTTAAELLGETSPKRNGAIPGGRFGQSFEAISKLPRRQQTKILDVVEALLAQHSGETSSS